MASAQISAAGCWWFLVGVLLRLQSWGWIIPFPTGSQFSPLSPCLLIALPIIFPVDTPSIEHQWGRQSPNQKRQWEGEGRRGKKKKYHVPQKNVSSWEIKELIINKQNNTFKMHCTFISRETLIGKRNPKLQRWFLYSQFSNFSYSNPFKRLGGLVPYLVNGTKLQHSHINIHKQTYRMVQLHPWFGIIQSVEDQSIKTYQV